MDIPIKLNDESVQTILEQMPEELFIQAVENISDEYLHIFFGFVEQSSTLRKIMIIFTFTNTNFQESMLQSLAANSGIEHIHLINIFQIHLSEAFFFSFQNVRTLILERFVLSVPVARFLKKWLLCPENHNIERFYGNYLSFLDFPKKEVTKEFCDFCTSTDVSTVVHIHYVRN